MTIQRVRVIMQNWPGAPGYINLYETSAVVDHTPIRNFFNSLITFIPTGITFTVPGTGDIINEGTGDIVGAWTVAAPAVVTATASGVYAGGAGAVVDWLTSGVVAGRRPMGRTFLVPLISTAMDAQGSLTASAITAIKTAADALIAAMGPTFLVWSRPFAGGPGGVPAARLGTVNPVVGSRVPDLAAVLRSRRT